MQISPTVAVLLLRALCVSAQAEEMFETLDKDGDGLLSRGEFKTFTQSAVGADGQMLGSEGLTQRRHFDSSDRNRDGKISHEEYMAVVQMSTPQPPDDGGDNAPAGRMAEIQQAVDMTMHHFDQNNDGRLDADELELLLQHSRGVDISKIDADLDGYVTREEIWNDFESR